MLKTIQGHCSTKCVVWTVILGEGAVVDHYMKLGPMMRFQSFPSVFIVLCTSDVDCISFEVSHVVGKLVVFEEDTCRMRSLISKLIYLRLFNAQKLFVNVDNTTVEAHIVFKSISMKDQLVSTTILNEDA